MKDDRIYFKHILDCIRKIEEDVAGGRASFDASHTIQDAVLRNLQVMAGSAQRISTETKARHFQVDWKGIGGFRNVLVHDYFGLDLGVIWGVVELDVPVLKRQVLAVLAESRDHQVLIRTLIFDLGKVIVDFSFEEAYAQMRQASVLTNDEIRERLLHGTLIADFETGRLGADAFVAEVNRRMGTAFTMEEFQQLWGSIFHATPLLEVSLLRRLRQQRRLVLLSNTNELHFETIRRAFPHISHFDALVLSHEVGVMKPDRAIYDAALEHAQCAGAECLFFDDLAANIEGARAAGWNARQFTGQQQLLRDLAEFGIAVE